MTFDILSVVWKLRKRGWSDAAVPGRKFVAASAVRPPMRCCKLHQQWDSTRGWLGTLGIEKRERNINERVDEAAAPDGEVIKSQSLVERQRPNGLGPTGDKKKLALGGVRRRSMVGEWQSVEGREGRSSVA